MSRRKRNQKELQVAFEQYDKQVAKCDICTVCYIKSCGHKNCSGSRPKIVPIIPVKASSGWVAGTEFLLYNGGTICVEDIKEGTILMGDDSTPRTVKETTLTSDSELYEVCPVTSFGDGKILLDSNHILMLRVNVEPVIVSRKRSLLNPDHVTFTVRWYEVDYIDNSLKRYSRGFGAEKKEAQDFAESKSGSFVWKTTIENYLSERTNKSTKYYCKIYKSSTILFPPPIHSLESVVKETLGISNSEIELETAWVLGMWLSDGVKRSPIISQGGPPEGEKHSHIEVMQRLMRWGSLCNLKVKQTLDQVSSSGNYGFSFRFPIQLLHILRSFGLCMSQIDPTTKFISHEWLTSSYKIRMSILAGLLDGDGYLHQGCYEITSKEKSFAEQVKFLAMSLGFRVGPISPKPTKIEGVDGERIQVYHRINISGNEIHLLSPYLALSYKRVKIGSLNPNKDALAFGFTLNKLKEKSVTYGFSVTGSNHHVIKKDWTICHDCTISS